MQNTFIIAEAGVNHNGQLALAKQLVDLAKEAGCDAVKFQSFLAEAGICRNAPKADYQLKLTARSQSQLAMIKSLELSYEDHEALIDHCQNRGIEFLTTVCDLLTWEWLRRFNLPAYKIASCDLVNVPLLRAVANSRSKVYLSTGMATLPEVQRAVAEIKQNNVREIILLHCTTEYPCPLAEVHLNKMLMLKEIFALPVGFSDHSEGISASLAAVALGAQVVERHITLDKDLPGPDHKASLNPAELKNLVRSIREVECALGDSSFTPTPSEIRNRPIMRRKIVAGQLIKQGDILSMDNLSFKRAAGGVTPDRIDDILGQAANKDYQPDEVILV
jgi:N,N'-diacetyllegionaminate synthase